MLRINAHRDPIGLRVILRFLQTPFCIGLLVVSTTAAETPPPAVAPFDAQQALTHQETWAKYLSLPVEYKDKLGIKFVLIPPGEFEMGSTEGELNQLTSGNADDKLKADLRNELPRHRVAITRPFYYATTELTIAQFRKFIEASKYRTELEETGGGTAYDPMLRQNVKKPEFNWSNPGGKVPDGVPVRLVTARDADAFANWLTDHERVTCRLPSEAEWEYACRAGTATKWFFGDDPAALVDYAWYKPNSQGITYPGAQKKPNPWGLYDLYGNVLEWCRDRYVHDFYLSSPKVDPSITDSAGSRVVRGGNRFSPPETCRSAHRTSKPQNYQYPDIGIRLVREIPISFGAPPVVHTTPAAVPEKPMPTSPKELPVAKRAVVPALAEQDSMRTKLREIYRSELQQAVNTEGHVRLVERLLRDSAADVDIISKYGMLDLARLHAVESTDPALLHHVLTLLAEKFELDEVELYLATLRDAEPKLRDGAVCVRMLKDIVTQIDLAFASAKFNSADELLAVASKLQTRARDPELNRVISDRRKQATAHRKAWEQAENAATTLVDKPDDPAANLVRGRYLCFTRGDWEEGLPHLAKGNDKTLTRLARRSLDVSMTAPSEIATLASDWWDEAQRNRGTATRYRELLRGAQYWYGLARPAIQGVDRKLAETRIADIEKTIGVVTRAAQISSRNTFRPDKLTFQLGNGREMVLRLIDAGKFVMGSPNTERDRGKDETQHGVTISRPYYIGQFEVTNDQWETVTGQKAKWDHYGPTAPAAATWGDVAAYCEGLNRILSTQAPFVGYAFRLPTEAEWEYACRADTTTATHFGDGLSSDQASFDGTSPYNGGTAGPQRPKPLPAGSFKPNAWGLFDMHGNAAEWTLDWYADYPDLPASDPVGPATGTERVLRGGASGSPGNGCRSARRSKRTPEYIQQDTGFRVVYGPIVRSAN
jgi:sulfatase modifying factor 1